MCGLRTLLALAGCVLLLCRAADALAGGARVSVGHVSIRPGETGEVDVRLHNDGSVAAFTGRVHFDASYIGGPELGWGGGTQLACRARVTWGIDVDIAPWPEAGVELLICRIPLRALAQIRRTSGLSLTGRCEDLHGAEVPCTLESGSVYIDGIEPEAERSMTFIPRTPPAAPARADIFAFDYTRTDMATPLAFLEAPRPHRLESEFGASAPPTTPGSGTANDAVLALRRSIRVLYADSLDMAAGMQRAAADPAVEAVLPYGYNPGISVYPQRPRANQSFALWITSGFCSYFVADGPDDRSIRVQPDRIVVDLRHRSDPCIPGPAVRRQVLLNMPGLAAGTYTLQVLPRHWQTGEPLDLAPHPQLQLVVGGDATRSPVAVPALGPIALLLASLFVGIGGLPASVRLRPH